MQIRCVVLLCAVVSILLQTDRTQASSCTKPSPCELFGVASAVFIGKVQGNADNDLGFPRNGDSPESGVVRFAVEESFKGVNETEITTRAFRRVALACGQTYLVYASKHDRLGLVIGPCSSTKRLEDAKEDLEFLRSLPAQGTGGRIHGRVALETGARHATPLSDFAAVIEDEEHSRLQVNTDRDGNYEVTGLKPGKYIAKPVLPDNFGPSTEYDKNRELEVSDRGCFDASFSVKVNGRITGRVSDSSGRPAPAYVTLESVDEPKRLFLEHTNHEGSYEISGISPGTYLLKIDMKKDERETAYFYPGAIGRSLATPIIVAMGQKIEGKDLSLPEQIQVIVVRGYVTYSDGRAATDVRVQLSPESDISTLFEVDGPDCDTETDELGRFTLYAYKGFVYEILASDDPLLALQEKRESRSAVEKRLLDRDVDDIKLVLRLEPRVTTPVRLKKDSNANRQN